MCKTLRSTVANIENNVQYKQRLLVVASESNKLVELDPVTGELVSTRPVRRALSRRVKTKEWWPTSIALCPYSGDFYICQYAVSVSHFWCLLELGCCKGRRGSRRCLLPNLLEVASLHFVLHAHNCARCAGEVCAPFQWRQPGLRPHGCRASRFSGLP